MADPKASANASADWTHLLTDHDLVSHLGELLRTYREAAPEQREQALLAAMREIKSRPKQAASVAANQPPDQTRAMAAAAAAPAMTSPPFAPDLFTSTAGQDRRQYPRMKCCVAVEINVAGSATPVWGTLCNTSLGGCLVETATPVSPGCELKLGLWVSTAKIWVKGIVLSGVVTRSTPSFGVRIKFDQMERKEIDSLREFLKFVQNATQEHDAQSGYVARLKQ
jgi:hypothetical protein